MPDPTQADGLEVLRSLLITHGGGFLRNFRWAQGITCPLCAGVNSNPDWPTCYKCQSWMHRDDLADRIGFVAYAVAGSQSGQVMYGYKAPTPSEANRRVVTLMHHYAFLRHRSCIDSGPKGPVTHWATVPSVGGRQGPHPLRMIAGSLLQSRLSEADLRTSATAIKTRELRPQNFESVISGDTHVLLVEDTWAGGGHVQSAANALMRAGARAVTTIVLARWLEPGRGNTKEFMGTLREDFDPDLCPFTGTAC